MPQKTRAKLKEETIKKAYFEYWRFQNNPTYLEFYNQNFNPHRLEGELYSAWAERLECAEKMNRIVIPELQKRFNLSYPPVDPFKRIDWFSFKNALREPDKEILFTFKSAQKWRGPVITLLTVMLCDEPLGYHWQDIKNRVKTVDSPLCFIPNHTYDKKEILNAISNEMDEWEKMRRVKRIRRRDSINKFHLYAQVWDLRKGHPKKSFARIAEMTGASRSTVKARFYKAFELIFGYPFNSEHFSAFGKKVYRESLIRHCGDCGERDKCTDACPDIMPYIMQDWGKRNYKEVQPSENNPKVMAHLGLAG